MAVVYTCLPSTPNRWQPLYTPLRVTYNTQTRTLLHHVAAVAWVVVATVALLHNFASPRPFRMSFLALGQKSGSVLLSQEIHLSLGSDIITLHPIAGRPTHGP